MGWWSKAHSVDISQIKGLEWECVDLASGPEAQWMRYKRPTLHHSLSFSLEDYVPFTAHMLHKRLMKLKYITDREDNPCYAIATRQYSGKRKIWHNLHQKRSLNANYVYKATHSTNKTSGVQGCNWTNVIKTWWEVTAWNNEGIWTVAFRVVISYILNWF